MVGAPLGTKVEEGSLSTALSAKTRTPFGNPSSLEPHFAPFFETIGLLAKRSRTTHPTISVRQPS